VIHKDLSKTLNYHVKGKPKVVIYWLAQLKNPQHMPTLSEEHTEFKFLNKVDAIELSGYKDFADMVEWFDGEVRKIHGI
jgi:bis(5'-nucleosidyl)-tetraphosphatase